MPASRGVEALEGAVHLASRLEAPLVALCSHATLYAEVVARLTQRPDCTALIVDVPAGFEHHTLPIQTAAARFRLASANRQSDLGLKRNLGLLLARLNGWGKILFLDDDIGHAIGDASVGISPQAIRRLAAKLDEHQIAGMACRKYPDNSVVCHARRLAGFPQDTFVSGAALGVNCNDRPLPFFPDLYNEDWFFFSRLAAKRDLAYVGDVPQAPYDPFATLDRARQEEFGDLLAEGLYGLFEEQPEEMDYRGRLKAADSKYWSRFIGLRRDDLRTISAELEILANSRIKDAGQSMAAIQALQAADQQLSTFRPELCVDFLDAWRRDLEDWERVTQLIRSGNGIADAMKFLGLDRWRSVGFHGSRKGTLTTHTRSASTYAAP